MHIHTCTHISLSLSLSLYIYISISLALSLYLSIYIYMYTCLYLYLALSLSLSLPLSLYVCIYIYIYREREILSLCGNSSPTGDGFQSASRQHFVCHLLASCPHNLCVCVCMCVCVCVCMCVCVCVCARAHIPVHFAVELAACRLAAEPTAWLAGQLTGCRGTQRKPRAGRGSSAPPERRVSRASRSCSSAKACAAALPRMRRASGPLPKDFSPNYRKPPRASQALGGTPRRDMLMRCLLGIHLPYQMPVPKLPKRDPPCRETTGESGRRPWETTGSSFVGRRFSRGSARTRHACGVRGRPSCDPSKLRLGTPESPSRENASERAARPRESRPSDLDLYMYVCVYIYTHIYIYRERYIHMYTCM